MQLNRETLLAAVRAVVHARWGIAKPGGEMERVGSKFTRSLGRRGSQASDVMTGDLRHVIGTGTVHKNHRPSWDRMLMWLDQLGYEVHFEVRLKGDHRPASPGQAGHVAHTRAELGLLALRRQLEQRE